MRRVLLAGLLVILPSFIAVGTLLATVAAGNRLDGEIGLYILPLALLMVFAVGRLGVRYLAAPSSIARLMNISCAVIVIIWVWQRLAYLIWVPNRFLTYGYFLTPSGERARVLVLQWPEAIGLILLAGSALVALYFCVRLRAHIFILPAMGWWAGTTALFWLPSFYLSAQGEATVFI